MGLTYFVAQAVAVEMTNYVKNPSVYKRHNNSCTDLLDIVHSWEREGWRGRSARLNQLLVERGGTNVQEDVDVTPSRSKVVNQRNTYYCLGLVIMVLLLVVIFQGNF